MKKDRATKSKKFFGGMVTGLLLIVWLTLVNNVQAQSCEYKFIPASTPDSQLVDNGDGTITDLKTGLMWQKCSQGQSSGDCSVGSAEAFTWQQALQRAQTVNSSGGFAGHVDWRLPNIKELVTLVERQCMHPAINLTRFPNTPEAFYWSSTPWIIYQNVTARIVYFEDGTTNYFGDSSQLRLVRSAP